MSQMMWRYSIGRYQLKTSLFEGAQWQCVIIMDMDISSLNILPRGTWRWKRMKQMLPSFLT